MPGWTNRPPAPTLADMRVDVDVIRLQQEFMTQPSRVRLTARIKVLNMKSGHVLATQVFEVLEPAPSEDAYGAARATNAQDQFLGEPFRKAFFLAWWRACLQVLCAG